MRKILLLFLLPVLSDGMFAQEVAAVPPAARFVWVDEDSSEQFQVAYFRRTVVLQGRPAEASLHLFADSRYVLAVNGVTVNFGPGRFYPNHPAFDTYDLRPYLRVGTNVIAIRVFSNGAATFQLRRHRPGLIVWGEVSDERGSSTDLTTNGERWLAHRAEGYSSASPKSTFALGPMELHDARVESGYACWDTDTVSPPNWQHPVVIPSGSWGRLVPRSIPHLTQTSYRPWKLIGTAAFDTSVHQLSTQFVASDNSWGGYRSRQTLNGTTHIYSPRNQRVSLLASPGQYTLNGAPVPTYELARGAEKQQRSLKLELKTGWNELSGVWQSAFGSTPVYFQWADSLGLRLSSRPDSNSEGYLAFAGPQTAEVVEKEGRRETVTGKGNPALDMVWQPLIKPELPDQPYTDGTTIEGDQPLALAYDFRYKKLGRIAIEYEAPPGTVFDISFAEDTLSDGWPYLMKRSGLYMGVRHVAAGGSGKFETLRPYGLRYLQIHVSGHQGPVHLHTVRVHHQVYPFRELGDFQCSDPLFNDIYELGWRSLRVCAEDSYTDTPFRERGLYAGDMLPQMAVTLTHDTDLRLVRRSLQLFQDMYADLFQPDVAKHPDEIELLEDYPLLTLEALDWYFDRTGDTTFVLDVFPNYDYLLRNILDRRNAAGLVPNDRVFIEWTRMETRNLVSTSYQAILTRVLRKFAVLAQELHLPEAAKFYAQAAEELSETAHANLWDAARHRYSDGVREGAQLQESYPISSVWADLAGLLPPEKSGAVFDYVASQMDTLGNEPRNKRLTPYGSFYVLSTMLEHGYTEAVEAFIRRQWAPMIYKRDDTAWENFDDVALGTLSHAWSAAPTYLFTAYTLGVKLGWPEPVTLDTIYLEPQSASLDWAEGTVPHPTGLIHVRWERQGKVLRMEVDSPPNIPLAIRPRGALEGMEVWLNGEPYGKLK